MKINCCCTHWGSEHLPPLEFLERLLSAGYGGIEINLSPGNLNDPRFFIKIEQLRGADFCFIAQQVLDPANETPSAYTKRMLERLEYLMDFKPDFINAHTGKDFYSFSENCRIIDEAENLAAKRGIPVLHETHRGRFSFHLQTLLPYLDTFPSLQLTGDFSHWCNVSESLLEDQEPALQKVVPYIGHIHARIGNSQSAQVNNPFAPEWESHLSRFVDWWKTIAAYRRRQGRQLFTMTPEFGPAPYMPELPFSREPLANQWDINVRMKNYLLSAMAA